MKIMKRWNRARSKHLSLIDAIKPFSLPKDKNRRKVKVMSTLDNCFSLALKKTLNELYNEYFSQGFGLMPSYTYKFLHEVLSHDEHE